MSLFGPDLGGIDLGMLRRERSAIADGRRAPSTRRCYESDWRDFTRWCATAGRAPLPASSDTIQLYAVGLAQRGLLPATIARRVTAISQRHLSVGQRSPVDADVREVLGGIRRRLGTAPRHAKAALSVEQLRAMSEACGRDPRGVRDRAILLLGFAAGMRRSELAALELADVTVEAGGVAVRIGRSKTDQEGRGRELGVHRGQRRATCPVRALAAWLKVRGDWAGSLFSLVVSRSNAIAQRGIRGRAIAEAVKSAAERAGIDAGALSGHSLRAGCATAASAGGASEATIMLRTGHRSGAMVRRYIRHGSLFAVDALAGVL